MPGASKVRLHDAPITTSGELHAPFQLGSSPETMSWTSAPSLTQRTVSPAPIVIASGALKKSPMDTVCVVFGGCVVVVVVVVAGAWVVVVVGGWVVVVVVVVAAVVVGGSVVVVGGRVVVVVVELMIEVVVVVDVS